ncbi:MAG TPA: integrase arm-type DNA-binding domain-containing protein [Thiobacillaceae bacterium]|nr:integrase arm-type DNA-binding domain-containing protein [Thiobacillaceae bacterium]
MGRVAQALSFKTVEKLSKVEGMHAVGGSRGLYLQCKNGGASWILRIMIDGKRRDIGLGSYHDVSLEEARDKCMDLRRKVRSGIDPLEDKRRAKQDRQIAKAKAMTFAECVEAYLDAHEDAWKNPKHRQQWRNTLNTYALPHFGDLPVAVIDTGLVMKSLEPIWKTKTETASRLRGRVEQILDWATVRGYRQGENPARWKGHMDKLLPKPSKVAKVEHHPALSYKELPGFILALRSMDGLGARALEFAILTAARSGEVRGATWPEIDLKSCMWIVPAERMKAKREHRVPLTAAAVDLLKALPRIDGADLLFPGTKGKLSDMTLSAVLKRMGRGDLTVHGFRSTFRDWAAEMTNHPREVAEMALAHAVGDKVEAAYRRGDLLKKRYRLMEDWARHCETTQVDGDNVLPFVMGMHT